MHPQIEVAHLAGAGHQLHCCHTRQQSCLQHSHLPGQTTDTPSAALCRRLLLLIRGIFGFGAIGNYLFAVTLLPLHEALVLTFTAPLWASILGPFLIKEVPQK